MKFSDFKANVNISDIDIVELRKRYGLHRNQLSDLFGIPRRTIENWEYKMAKCPDYWKLLIAYALQQEFADGVKSNDGCGHKG